jgi:hypothetical protein
LDEPILVARIAEGLEFIAKDLRKRITWLGLERLGNKGYQSLGVR